MQVGAGTRLRLGGAFVALASACLVLSPAVAQQTAPTTGWGSQVQTPPPAAPPPLKGMQVETPPVNTTVVPRPTVDSRTSGQISFSAQLTDDGPPLDQGLIWRIYRDKPGPDGKMRMLSQHRDAQPQLRLDVGDYMVHVAYGRANLTRRLTVAAGKAVSEKFVINAGGLKITATLASGEVAPDNTVLFDVMSDDRDQFGERIAVLTRARPGVVLRLNAGIYQIQSTYGDANATVRGEVAVEPGKITEATLAHSAAKVTFRLVPRAGAEALPDTQWIISSTAGDVVKESAGAIPTHTLAPGSYIATAKRVGLSFKRDFSVQAGDNVYVEVLAAQSP